MDLDAFAAHKKFTQSGEFLSTLERSTSRCPRSKWTPERTNQLVELAAQGKSGSEIAEIIGTTRSAILGRANRLGIQLKGTRPKIMDDAHIRRRENFALRRAGKPTNTRKYVRKIKLNGPLTRAVIARVSQRETKIVSNPVSLLMLESHHCRWVIGEPASFNTMYCGAVVAPDKPYCQGHCNIAYRGVWHAA